MSVKLFETLRNLQAQLTELRNAFEELKTNLRAVESKPSGFNGIPQDPPKRRGRPPKVANGSH